VPPGDRPEISRSADNAAVRVNIEAGSTEDPPSFATLAAWSIAFVRRSCPEERFGEAGWVARGVVAVALDEAEACVLMYFGNPRCVDIFVLYR
jgi:hypothetical protein